MLKANAVNCRSFLFRKRIIEYFDNRIAAEIRLPEAIDRKLLCPFHYFGVTDNVDLQSIRWSRNGYDKSELDKILTGNDMRAKLTIDAINKYCTDVNGEATAGDTPNEVLQLENYGTPQKPPFDLTSNFNRKFKMILNSKFGFYNGMPAYLWTINGEVFPDTPTFVVKEGDLVKIYIENLSPEPHPMHLHGHHVLVLSKNGKAIAGSPWWTDSLNVAPGERFEIGFVADNPGMWMDHCHNLQHVSVGMALHVMYEGITTPFMIGKKTGNMPE